MFLLPISPHTRSPDWSPFFPEHRDRKSRRLGKWSVRRVPFPTSRPSVSRYFPCLFPSILCFFSHFLFYTSFLYFQFFSLPFLSSFLFIFCTPLLSGFLETLRLSDLFLTLLCLCLSTSLFTLCLCSFYPLSLQSLFPFFVILYSRYFVSLFFVFTRLFTVSICIFSLCLSYTLRLSSSPPGSLDTPTSSAFGRENKDLVEGDGGCMGGVQELSPLLEEQGSDSRVYSYTTWR